MLASSAELARTYSVFGIAGGIVQACAMGASGVKVRLPLQLSMRVLFNILDAGTQVWNILVMLIFVVFGFVLPFFAATILLVLIVSHIICHSFRTIRFYVSKPLTSRRVD